MRSLIPFFLMAALLPAQSQQVQAALAAGSYFPLEVGNRWVYRIENGFESRAYQTWSVDRVEEHDGRTYFVVAIRSKGSLLGESLFRVDDGGRVFLRTGLGDLLFLDASDSTGNAQLRIQSKGIPFRAPIGSFSDTLNYRNSIDAFRLELGTLGRGIGLLASTATLLTGSSGGFYEGRTLVEAVIGGRLQFTLNSTGLQLGLESLSLDLTGKQADNCAIPCYSAACGWFGLADPPGTYKPCARARVALTNWPADASRTVRLKLFSPDGQALIDQTVSIEREPGEAATFSQLRLYSQPNQPFPPGAYRLEAATEDGAAQSAVTLQIK
jgi:hypothetical protein